MPTSKIKKDAREGKGSVKSLENKWDKAKDAAKGEGHGGNDWPLTMHIYENMTKSGLVTAATSRLKASLEQNDGSDSDDPKDFASQVFDAEGMNAGRGGYIEN